MAGEYYTRADAFSVLRSRGFFQFHTDAQLRSMVRTYARKYVPEWLEPRARAYRQRQGRIWARWRGGPIPEGYVSRPYFNTAHISAVAQYALVCAGCSRPVRYRDDNGCDGWATPAPLCADCHQTFADFAAQAVPAVTAARGAIKQIYSAVKGA